MIARMIFDNTGVTTRVDIEIYRRVKIFLKKKSFWTALKKAKVFPF